MAQPVVSQQAAAALRTGLHFKVDSLALRDAGICGQANFELHLRIRTRKMLDRCKTNLDADRRKNGKTDQNRRGAATDGEQSSIPTLVSQRQHGREEESRRAADQADQDREIAGGPFKAGNRDHRCEWSCDQKTAGKADGGAKQPRNKGNDNTHDVAIVPGAVLQVPNDPPCRMARVLIKRESRRTNVVLSLQARLFVRSSEGYITASPWGSRSAGR